MPLIQFPNVPNVPGVPSLLRSFTVPSLGALFNLGVASAARAIFGSTVWGVFAKDGSAALEPDSFVGINYRNGGVVANYPMEAGAFASYDKSANPYDCSITLTIGSDKAARTSFLAKCERMAQGLELFSVVTPEATYINANLQTWEYRRGSGTGVSLITVTLNFIQIRLTATSSTRQTQAPSGMDTSDVGQIQINEPTDDQIALEETIV